MPRRDPPAGGQERRWPGPRRRRAPRPRALAGAGPPGAGAACSPAATRSCSSTRSTPNTASVTGCSTCSRVFISRKKKPSSRQHELDRAGALVARRPARARPPPRPSARAAASSTAGEGASSTTFWWRRCSEHSRSPRCTQPPCAVGEDLHLDVAGAARGSARPARGRRRTPRRPRGVRRRARPAISSVAAHDAHPAPAAARDRLDDGREPVLGAERADRPPSVGLALRARDDRHARVARARLRARLVAHELDRRRPAGRPRSGPRRAPPARTAALSERKP